MDVGDGAQIARAAEGGKCLLAQALPFERTGVDDLRVEWRRVHASGADTLRRTRTRAGRLHASLVVQSLGLRPDGGDPDVQLLGGILKIVAGNDLLGELHLRR